MAVTTALNFSRVNKYLSAYFILMLLFALSYFVAGESFKDLKGFNDAVYLSIVTATTLGYGDITPTTVICKYLVCAQALSSVMLVGLFLNSLSYQQSERIRLNDKSADWDRKEGLRDGLDRHVSLMVEALKTSNPMIWDKHAIHCGPLNIYSSYMIQLQADLERPDFEVDGLKIKILLECADQMYDSYVALLPVAADISPEYLMRWSSIVSNIRNLRGQYSEAVKIEPFDGKWPAYSDIRFQLVEILESSIFISEPLEVDMEK